MLIRVVIGSGRQGGWRCRVQIRRDIDHHAGCHVGGRGRVWFAQGREGWVLLTDGMDVWCDRCVGVLQTDLHLILMQCGLGGLPSLLFLNRRNKEKELVSDSTLQWTAYWQICTKQITDCFFFLVNAQAAVENANISLCIDTCKVWLLLRLWRTCRKSNFLVVCTSANVVSQIWKWKQ